MSFWAKISSFFERKTIEKADQITEKVTFEAKQIEKSLNESKEAVGEEEVEIVEPARARNKKGKFIADDKSTEDVNEAWVGGKAPKKTSNNKPKVIRKKSR